MKVIKKVSNETTWGAIQKDVDEGKAGEYQVGTVVVETLKDGRQMPYALAAVNHYQPDELIFVNMENYGDYRMNKKDTNEGGWNKSEMRRHANEDILTLLPDDMVAVIAPRIIVEVENDGTEVESIDKLWGLSIMEVGGDWYIDNDNGVDKQLPYFEDRANRMLKATDGKSVCNWWERSPYRHGSHDFYNVGISGYPNTSYWANNSYGVCLGFAIRKSERKGKTMDKNFTKGDIVENCYTTTSNPYHYLMFLKSGTYSKGDCQYETCDCIGCDGTIHQYFKNNAKFHKVGHMSEFDVFSAAIKRLKSYEPETL